MIRVELRTVRRRRHRMLAVGFCLAVVAVIFRYRDPELNLSERLLSRGRASAAAEPPESEAARPSAAAPGARQEFAGPLQFRTACRRALTIMSRLPESIRVTSLSANATGGFAVEGATPIDHKAVLVGFLDTLVQLPASASLSYWREKGDRQRSHTFLFQGQLADLPASTRYPAPTVAAATLLTDVMQLAARAQLRGIGSELDTSGSSRSVRAKLWATGTQAQIAAFADSVGTRERAVLGEMLLAPMSATDMPGAQLFATIDLLVAHSVHDPFTARETPP